MAELKLPDRVQQSLVDFSVTSDEAVDELYKQLSDSMPAFFSDNFIEGVASKLRLWERPKFDQVVSALVGLCLSRTGAGQPLDQFIESVLATLRKSAADTGTKISLPPDREAELKKRLQRFLGLPAFDVSARAFDVMTAHQRVFLTSRIFSDVRSVFHEDVEDGPAAGVIVHTLKIEYREDNARKSLYFALDSKDIGMLAEVVKRAQKKDAALRKTMTTANIPFMEPK